MNYYSELNDLVNTPPPPPNVSNSIYPWKIDTINNRIGRPVFIEIKPIKTVVTDIHNITSYYLIYTHDLEPGVYVIPFPQDKSGLGNHGTIYGGVYVIPFPLNDIPCYIGCWEGTIP